MGDRSYHKCTRYCCCTLFFGLTVAFVFVTRKRETTAALALITPFCIVTDLIAASVIGATLVHVYRKGQKKKKKIQSVH